MKTKTMWLHKAVTIVVRPALLIAGLVLALVPPGSAQENASSANQLARVEQPAPPTDKSADDNAKEGKPPETSPAITDPAAVTKELEGMKTRIEQLEMELKASQASKQQPSTAAITGDGEPPAKEAVVGQAETPQSTASQEKPAPSAPFAFADWTWLNGTPRNKDAVWDSRFFTPEVRFDTNYIYSYNHPKDDSLGGSTEIFRSDEFQVEQISFGGDFHWQNVRGRVLTLGGMFGVTTPRNDASVDRGQWDLRGAYKYFAEAYGGYHFNVNHGLNVDAGIFVSYIGLFSYYNFDNWAYQPSFVSSNTPWFFNGLRIQWFPTDKLKIEPWIINGWQSYGRYGSKPGLGGQILYRPKQWVSLVFNNYGMGEDTLGSAPGSSPQFGLLGLNGLGRSRIHTDDSVEIKYYDHPEKFLDKMAFSVTGDLGCEYGAGVTCHGHSYHNGVLWPQQSFAGWMGYNRFWFHKDEYAITLGYGAMDNPGRYLTLLPPINGADAVSGSPYYVSGPQMTANGVQQTRFKGWDTLITYDWMPREYITFRSEFGYRHSDEPYWSGPNGITPPGGNNGSPGYFVCNNGVTAGTADPNVAVGACTSNGGVWYPNLVKDEPSLRFAIMVKF